MRDYYTFHPTEEAWQFKFIDFRLNVKKLDITIVDSCMINWRQISSTRYERYEYAYVYDDTTDRFPYTTIGNYRNFFQGWRSFEWLDYKREWYNDMWTNEYSTHKYYLLPEYQEYLELGKHCKIEVREDLVQEIYRTIADYGLHCNVTASVDNSCRVYTSTLIRIGK